MGLYNFQIQRIERFITKHIKKIEQENKRMERENRKKLKEKEKDERTRLRQERRDYLKSPEGVLSAKKNYQERRKVNYEANREDRIKAVRACVIRKRIEMGIEVKPVGRPKRVF